MACSCQDLFQFSERAGTLTRFFLQNAANYLQGIFKFLCHIMNGSNRKDVNVGLWASIVLKQDQPSGKLTEGIVKDILTKSPTHPHGIEVHLESYAVGRVKIIQNTSK